MAQEQVPKSMVRRLAIGAKRKDRPSLLRDLRSKGVINSLWVAAGFFVCASAIVMLRQNVVAFRPGQYTPQDIRSRVDFTFNDKSLLTAAIRDARNAEPRWYKLNQNGWDDLQDALLALPKILADKTLDQVPADLQHNLGLTNEPGALTAFHQLGKNPDDAERYQNGVREFVKALRGIVVVNTDDYLKEAQSVVRKSIKLEGAGDVSKDAIYPLTDEAGAAAAHEKLVKLIKDAAHDKFGPWSGLHTKISLFALATLKPTHLLDEAQTQAAQNQAADRVDHMTPSKATVSYKAGQIIVGHGLIDERYWQLLWAENQAFNAQLGMQAIKLKLGLAGIVLVLTAMMAAYVAVVQPRIVRNAARSLAIAVLMVMMLLLAQLAAIGTGPLYMFGLAPTILVAMIVSIAYDRRFAMAVSALHGLLVAVALNQGVGFFAILWAGSMTCCLMLDTIRNRGKLVEVGGATALAMIAVTIAAGAMAMDPGTFIFENCLYAGGAGLAVGFIVLGILPFIEKLFKISTGMTLLELADSGQPLLRRLALEAPGTYNHSMQVAVLAEAAGEAIKAQSLLCRVASYYHDIGKINKPDYFVENQTGGPSKHLNLSPNVSLLIILGHVKDGMALAREYNLPQQILPFISQHHGTTLVEYFYYQACVQKDQRGQPDQPEISDLQYRYSGPKPKSREIAIVMLADTVESAARAMREPNAGSIENLVHDLTMKRLLDGQFDECDITISEIAKVEQALTKTLQSIYHGRIAYPSMSSLKSPALQPAAAEARTA